MKTKSNVVPIELGDVKLEKGKGKTKQIKIKKFKSDKKYLKQVEKAVRKLDNAISELNEVGQDLHHLAHSLEYSTTEISDKDVDRTTEMFEVVDATLDILYNMATRMSRKYVGKDLDDIKKDKRKSLKV